jgi:hypothetical protein
MICLPLPFLCFAADMKARTQKNMMLIMQTVHIRRLLFAAAI